MCQVGIYKCVPKLLPRRSCNMSWLLLRMCTNVVSGIANESFVTSVAAAKTLFPTASSVVTEKNWCGVVIAVWKNWWFCIKRAPQSRHCSLPIEAEVPIHMVTGSSCCCYLSVIFNCNVSMLCAYAVSSLYRDREKGSIALGKIRVVVLRLGFLVVVVAISTCLLLLLCQWCSSETRTC